MDVAEGGLARAARSKREAGSQFGRNYHGGAPGDIVLDEVPDKESTAPGLKAVKLFAKFMSDPDGKSAQMEQLKKLQGDSATGNDPTLQVVAAYMFIAEGMH